MGAIAVLVVTTGNASAESDIVSESDLICSTEKLSVSAEATGLALTQGVAAFNCMLKLPKACGHRKFMPGSEEVVGAAVREQIVVNGKLSWGYRVSCRAKCEATAEDCKRFIDAITVLLETGSQL